MSHPLRGTQKDSTSKPIAKCNRHFILDEEVEKTDFGTHLHAGHNVEHVSDTVLKPKSSECKNWPPHAEDLGKAIFGCHCLPHSEADQPIGTHTADESLAPRIGCLLHCNR